MAPRQKPGRSEQTVVTPMAFVERVERWLGTRFEWDLAADASNCILRRRSHISGNLEGPVSWFGPGSPTAEDALSAEMRWPRIGWLWCNPPFSDLALWVEKARDERWHGAKTAMLVPASTGANWWLNHVDGTAEILLLNGRITFDGHTSPYPKDLALLLYAPDRWPGYHVWDWRRP